MYARQNPNSGYLKTLQFAIDKRIEEWLKKGSRWFSFKPGESGEEILQTLAGGSVRAMSASCVQIAMENIPCSHYALRVISRIVDSLKDEQEKSEIIKLEYAELCELPNSV